MAQLYPYVNRIGASNNAVHFTILMAAAKSIRRIGGVERGRSL
jgi:hypothetical protein